MPGLKILSFHEIPIPNITRGLAEGIPIEILGFDGRYVASIIGDFIVRWCLLGWTKLVIYFFGNMPT